MNKLLYNMLTIPCMVIAMVSCLLLMRCPEHMLLLSVISFTAIMCGIGVCYLNTYLHNRHYNSQHLHY